MRKFKILPLLLLLLTLATSAAAQKKTQKTYIPWSNGKLVVSEEGRYLKHENGIPDRKSTRLNSSHVSESRMPSSA